MAHLTISLLGPFHASLDGKPIGGFESMKSRALLAFLADEPGREHARTQLADLLWPERPDVIALNNLRHVLANLRKAIQDQEASPPFLKIDRQAIALDQASDCSIDTQDFRRLVGGSYQCSGTGAAYAKDLEQAVALYRGDFLEAFLVDESAVFEEWLELHRELYRSLVLEALSDLAEAGLAQADYGKAKAFARRQIEIEPGEEEAHRQLMRALALDGRRSEALLQYAACCAILKRELGVSPSQATTRLFEQIRADYQVFDRE